MAKQKKWFRKVVKFCFISLNVLAVVLLTLAVFIPNIRNEQFWPIGFIGLAFPYIVLMLFLSIVFWLIVKPRLALISVMALLVGYKQISVFFGFSLAGYKIEAKDSTTLRIVTWNVQSFNGLTKNKNTKRLIREDILDLIKHYQPDIICLQEFNHSKNAGPPADNLDFFKKEFPYIFFPVDYAYGNYQTGTIILSKLPIVGTGKLRYANEEHLLYASVTRGIDTIRVYTTHLQSFNFKPTDYQNIEHIKQQESLRGSRSLIRKLRTGNIFRNKQADLVSAELEKFNGHSIICGDFNDVPNSYTYFTIKHNRQDAFLQKDFGLGRSFVAIAPTLRIDYILPSQSLEVIQFDSADEGLSDHVMLVCDVRVKK